MPRLGVTLAVLSVLALLTADLAAARVGSGGSFGSRGTRTFTPPPTTNTAPKTAAPVDKSIAQPAPSATSTGQSGVGAPASRFGGLRGLLLGGLIAAGLASIFGVGALASILGFALQMLLIAGIVWLALAYFRSRRTGQPVFAPSGGRGQDIPIPQADTNYRANANYGTNGRAAAAAAPALNISQDDLDTFERMLGDIQGAYSREDTRRLGDMTTPEMLSYFSQELANNARRGVRNEVSGVRLLQGDVSEAWREPGSDYATVAMRYALRDTLIDRASGGVVSGSGERDEEVTELWTFRRDDRDRATGWQLSAIQQA
ncbi:MAG TPA: TIM44-like domain-containing protein [Hyphomicrobiaceae bacterium]|jgi:predicted lipid-binding transport protein (Tim44 family)|nr:TIM44-like domain-containing protein [Hyphomicrobiaceae bacterium]